jgi:hypothetical protein
MENPAASQLNLRSSTMKLLLTFVGMFYEQPISYYHVTKMRKNFQAIFTNVVASSYHTAAFPRLCKRFAVFISEAHVALKNVNREYILRIPRFH